MVIERVKMESMTIVEVELDSRARDFVKAELDVGGPLAKRILEAGILEHGALSTFVDSSVSSDLYAWTSGGKLLQPEPSSGWKIPGGVVVKVMTADTWIVETLLSESAGRGSTAVISEDVTSRRTDSWQNAARRTHVFVGDQVLNVVLLSEGAAAILRSMQTASSSWYALSVWTSAPVRHPADDPADWSDAEVTAVIANAEFVMLGAYDGESWVLWRRER